MVVCIRKQQRIFSAEEIDFIIKSYEDMTNQEIADKLGNCNSEQIRYQLKKRKLKRTGGTTNWTKDEEEFLKSNYKTKSDYEIGQKLNRSPVGILKKRLKNNWKRPDGLHIMYNYPEKAWTEEELMFLIENFNELDIDELQTTLNRSEKAIQAKAARIGIMVQNTSWQEKEDEYLKKNYKEQTTIQIAKHLNRSERSVYHRRIELGLSREYWSSAPERQLGVLLNDMGLNPIPQFKIGPFYFDFLIKENILIEFNGDYYHCNPKLYPEGPIHTAQYVRIEADARKKRLAEEKGYTVIYVWEWDFNNDIEKVKKQISRL